jgi:hypothetical protein
MCCSRARAQEKNECAWLIMKKFGPFSPSFLRWRRLTCVFLAGTELGRDPPPCGYDPCPLATPR